MTLPLYTRKEKSMKESERISLPCCLTDFMERMLITANNLLEDPDHDTKDDSSLPWTNAMVEGALLCLCYLTKPMVASASHLQDVILIAQKLVAFPDYAGLTEEQKCIADKYLIVGTEREGCVELYVKEQS